MFLSLRLEPGKRETRKDATFVQQLQQKHPGWWGGTDGYMKKNQGEMWSK